MSSEEKPVGVHLGFGGDPLVLGMPAFSIGSLALGMGLLGLPAGLSIVAPLLLMTTGVWLFVCTCWAIILGISIVASIFGLFGGFWLTLGVVLIGTQHGWFGVPHGDVGDALQLLYIAYASLFTFLVVPCLKLPTIYPAIVILVVIALALAAAGLTAIAAYFILAFAFLGFWAFVNVAQTAMGGRPFPPIG